ncbi:hypothetical protein GJAV_G00197090 [Gymnothorax javanicus]|nr:hypothetical protein GJAV_G00197090 [Gymnothorax javanicus]
MIKGFILFMACAITLAVALPPSNEKESNPSASISPAGKFDKPTAAPDQNVTLAPNTSTQHPNTTHAPNTTTQHPNTTHAPNATTHDPKPTLAPNVTTHHPKTTTLPPPPPLPTPKANLTVANYTLKNGSDVCAMATMALQIRVEYDSKKKLEGAYIVQKATVKGSCDKSSVNFNITFKDGFICLHFHKNVTDKSVYVSSVAVGLTYPLNPAEPRKTYSATNSSMNLFRAGIGHSYSCQNQSVYIGDGIHVDMTKGQMQAFNITKNFGPPELCPADQSDYRVAIAVGIVLLILIIIVVVAYLIGRRKRTDGYQSL